MITLGQHNRNLQELGFSSDNEPRRNGIECPDCDAELYDSTPSVVLTSMPPKHSVHCDECSYRGYRY